MRILLVEDEKRLADAIEYILKKNKYIVDVISNGEDGLDYSLSNVYDLIILDIMLPKLNGIEILKNIRKNKLDIPVLFLTAKTTIQDKIQAFNSGADDYLTKPFETEELLLRVRAMLRRKKEIIESTISFSDLILNLENYTLSCNDKTVSLSLKEFHIMNIFITNNKNTISKEHLIEKIWGFEKDVEYNNVEVYISYLRKKLASINSKVKIKTFRGIGYYLEE